MEQTSWIIMFLLPALILFVFIGIVKVVEKIWDRRKNDEIGY